MSKGAKSMTGKSNGRFSDPRFRAKLTDWAVFLALVLAFGLTIVVVFGGQNGTTAQLLSSVLPTNQANRN